MPATKRYPTDQQWHVVWIDSDGKRQETVTRGAYAHPIRAVVVKCGGRVVSVRPVE